MRKNMPAFLASVLVLVFVSSVASAEVLMTASPLGKGKVNLLVGAKVDQNYFDMGNGAAMFLDTVRYGFNDKLDVYALAGLGYSQKATDRPRTMDPLTMFTAGLGLKYTLVNENPDTRQISIALNAAIKNTSVSKANMTSWQYIAGIIGSKRIKNFNPYGGVTYRSTRQDYGDYSQIDYTLGTGLLDNMLLIEDTLQTIAFAGTNFVSNQISLAFSFNLN